MSKKRMRPIIVDGVAYRWWLRQATPITFSAELAEARGQILVAELPGTALAQNWPCYCGPEGSVVMPATAEAIIRVALDRGWQPAGSRVPFPIVLPTDELPLPATIDVMRARASNRRPEAGIGEPAHKAGVGFSA